MVLDDGSADSDDDGRPDDCDCGDWNAGLELPCFPCYRDAFENSGAENFTDFVLNYYEIGSERVEVDGE